MSGHYVDNAMNRRLGRVGMPYGSAVHSSSGTSTSSRVYVDNAMNRSLGRVGLAHGTAVHSRSSCGTSTTSQVYVDNSENRRLDRVGLPRGSVPHTRSSSSSSTLPRVYVDNPENRRLGRVGLVVGTAVHSRSSGGTSTSLQLYVDNAENRRLGRVGLPRGSLPHSRSSPANSRRNDVSSSSSSSLSSSPSPSPTRVQPTVPQPLPRPTPIQPSVPQTLPHPTPIQPTVLQTLPHPTPVQPTVLQTLPHPTPVQPTVLQTLPHPTPVQPTVLQTLPHPTLIQPTIPQILPHPTPIQPTFPQTIPHPTSIQPTVPQTLSHPTPIQPTVPQTLPHSTPILLIVDSRSPAPVQPTVPQTPYHPKPSQPIIESSDSTTPVQPIENPCSPTRAQSTENSYSSESNKNKKTEQESFQKSAASTEIVNQKSLADRLAEKLKILEQDMIADIANKNKKIEFKSKHAILFEDLEFGDKIGSGAFGDVHVALWKDQLVAVKKLRVQRVRQSKKKQFEDEVRSIAALNHPNIVKFYGACVVSPNLALVMEYLPDGSLYENLYYSQIQFDDKIKIQFIRDCFSALIYIHSNNMVHRDIKSKNIMLYDGRTHCKLTDFGTALKDEIETNTSTKHYDFAGTEKYCPKEVLEGERLTVEQLKSVDVYSLALTTFELLIEEEPFNECSNIHEIRKAIMNGKILQTLASDDFDISQPMKKLLRKALSLPQKRPSAAQFLKEFERIVDDRTIPDLRQNDALNSHDTSESSSSEYSDDHTMNQRVEQVEMSQDFSEFLKSDDTSGGNSYMKFTTVIFIFVLLLAIVLSSEMKKVYLLLG